MPPCLTLNAIWYPLTKLSYFLAMFGESVPRRTVRMKGAAFGRLFRYITGANTAGNSMATTSPAEHTPRLVPMTVPVELSGGRATMRFFLPASLASHPPAPTDGSVHVVRLPAITLGVVRYSGIATGTVRTRQAARLRSALVRAGRTPTGEPSAFSYDPPFALPIVRRNEIALQVH